MLARLRTSVSNLNPTGRSRATNAPLDDKDDIVMGDSQRQRRPRPRRNITSEELGAPLPMDDDDDTASTPVHVPQPAVATSGGDNSKELVKVKAEKQALEEKQKTLDAKLKKVSEELEEAQESISVYEEMMRSFTKKDENDLQDFVDLVGEWKGKAKVFDQGQKAIEDNKNMQKQMAQMKPDLDSQRQKLAEAETAARRTGDGRPTGASSSALDAATKEWKAKYEQAIKDLDAAKSKVAGLEKDVKSKESEIAELKGRLQVALATNTGGGAPGSMEDDPLIEMVEKLMKEMEAMAKENEEYMARLEEEIFSADKPDDSSSETKDTDSITPIPTPARVEPPKTASAPAASPKMPPAVQQSSSQMKAPSALQKPGLQPQQQKK